MPKQQIFDDPNPPSPGLWKLTAAAPKVGLTPRQLANACSSGHIAVRLVVLGAKSRFVVVEDFRAWMATLNGRSPRMPEPEPDENLF